jgi:type II secretory pathway pseudopilin PulG
MQPQTIGIVFAIVGVVMLVIAVVVFSRTRRFLATALSAQGTVIEMIERTRRDREGRTSTVWAPRVQFSVSGQTIEFESKVGSSPPRYKEGQAIEVKYDPQDPNNARVAAASSMWLVPALVGGIGVIFLIVGLGMAIAG